VTFDRSSNILFHFLVPVISKFKLLHLIENRIQNAAFLHFIEFMIIYVNILFVNFVNQLLTSDYALCEDVGMSKQLLLGVVTLTAHGG
jgi:hypothetical protein